MNSVHCEMGVCSHHWGNLLFCSPTDMCCVPRMPRHFPWSWLNVYIYLFSLFLTLALSGLRVRVSGLQQELQLEKECCRESGSRLAQAQKELNLNEQNLMRSRDELARAQTRITQEGDRVSMCTHRLIGLLINRYDLLMYFSPQSTIYIIITLCTNQYPNTPPPPKKCIFPAAMDCMDYMKAFLL